LGLGLGLGLGLAFQVYERRLRNRMEHPLVSLD